MVPRHLPKKLLCFALVGTSILAVIYYANGISPDTKFNNSNQDKENELKKTQNDAEYNLQNKGLSTPKEGPRIMVQPAKHIPTSEKSPDGAAHKIISNGQDPDNIAQTSCSNDPIMERVSDLDTTNIFPNLDFNATWIPRREYWSAQMQKRYQHRRTMWDKVPLKVILMPHSHNDPGWLKTYEGYFNSKTKDILNYAVDKLTEHQHMTFVWTEIAFLSMWWDEAHSSRRKNLKRLIEEGRFEVLTGGWVMTDEANVHIYAMVDQMIEGHQWLLNTFGIKPKSSWSVDPFGHGGTFPYVLKASGVDKGMVIMRIHYAWKEFFAREQSGDFMWQQKWDQSSGGGGGSDKEATSKPGKHSILCHNFPYDIYSVKGSCGPSADVCVQFNFGVLGSQVHFNEYTRATRPITPSNIKERSELILDQYGKTGSLYPHNVVLVPLGDDFMYYEESMWDSQYKNYKKIIDYINDHRDIYHTDIRFGTLSDYFDEVNARMKEDDFSTLAGDFFVYSDIFSEGIPAYWSGYFSTRPFMKQLSRELEANLRAAEILFTVGYQTAKKANDESAINFFSNAYSSKILTSRQNLALFQHHDAITGTSKQFVMHDYGLKMFDGIRATRSVQRNALQFLMQGGSVSTSTENRNMNLEDDFERANYNEQPKPLPLDVKSGDAYLVVFNSLANDIYEVISFFVEDVRVVTDLCIVDPNEKGSTKFLKYQANPTRATNDEGTMHLDTNFVEVIFVAKLPALSSSKFKVFICSDEPDIKDSNNNIKSNKENLKQLKEKTKVYCLRCPSKTEGESTLGIDAFIVDKLPNEVIQLENSNLLLTFDVDTKLLASIRHKKESGIDKVPKDRYVEIVFGAYPTQQFRNGAYLFSTDPRRSPNVDVFTHSDLNEVVVVSGPVFSELSLSYQSGNVHPRGNFVHTVRLYHEHEGFLHVGSDKSKETKTSSFSLSKGIYIENHFDFGDQDNHRDLDLFMRIKSKVKNRGPTFYTDQNGFQMQKRKQFSGLGVEGNIYPITTMAYIEDTKERISLIVDHASAATSHNQGSLEVIVDRRATFDDARGMGEGILDSVDTVHKYWLLHESIENLENKQSKSSKSRNPKRREQNEPTPKFLSHPTDLANFLSRRINYPTIQYMGKSTSRGEDNKAGENERGANVLNQQIKLMKSKGFPCNVHLFNLRTLSHEKFYTVPDASALIILNKQSSGDENCNNYNNNCDHFNEDEEMEENYKNVINFELNQPINFKKVTRTTLTGNDLKPQSVSEPVIDESHKSDSDDVDNSLIQLSNGISLNNISTFSNKISNTLSNLNLEPMALETFKVDF